MCILAEILFSFAGVNGRRGTIIYYYFFLRLPSKLYTERTSKPEAGSYVSVRRRSTNRFIDRRWSANQTENLIVYAEIWPKYISDLTSIFKVNPSSLPPPINKFKIWTNFKKEREDSIVFQIWRNVALLKKKNLFRSVFVRTDSKNIPTSAIFLQKFTWRDCSGLRANRINRNQSACIASGRFIRIS